MDIIEVGRLSPRYRGYHQGTSDIRGPLSEGRVGGIDTQKKTCESSHGSLSVTIYIDGHVPLNASRLSYDSLSCLPKYFEEPCDPPFKSVMCMAYLA